MLISIMLRCHSRSKSTQCAWKPVCVQPPNPVQPSFELKVEDFDTLTSSGKTVGERNIQVDRNHLCHSRGPSFSCCRRDLICWDGSTRLMRASTYVYCNINIRIAQVDKMSPGAPWRVYQQFDCSLKCSYAFTYMHIIWT